MVLDYIPPQWDTSFSLENLQLSARKGPYYPSLYLGSIREDDSKHKNTVEYIYRVLKSPHFLSHRDHCKYVKKVLYSKDTKLAGEMILLEMAEEKGLQTASVRY